MNSNDLSHLTALGMKDAENDKHGISDRMFGHPDDYAAEAERLKQETNVPDGMRTPTATELKAMREYAAEYKRLNPKAKVREVKRATARKFGVTVLNLHTT